MSMASNDIMSAHIRVFNLGNLRRLDIWLSMVVLVLAGIGVMVLYSTTRSTSSATPYYLRQMMFIPVGCMLALSIMCIDYRFLVSLAPFFYVVLVCSLIAVLLVGVEAKGATRWLQLGPIRIQPSEQSKLGLIFMLAWYLSSIGNRIRQIPYFLLTFIIAAIPAVLIFRQPNLGTAATLGPVVFAMLYMAGCKRSHLVGIVVLALVAAPVGWSQLKDYQKTRVMSILNPGADELGSGYHTTQSMITVGSGGPFGKGYMEGTQTYLSYLPEHHTDFIFSLLAEEWGFVGSVGVLGLFLFLFMRALYIARKCPEMSGTLLAVGIVTLLAFHVFVNIAITLGIAPVTGIPLPFLSYGRSFYLTTMMCVGVLLSINTRKGLFI